MYKLLEQWFTLKVNWSTERDLERSTEWNTNFLRICDYLDEKVELSHNLFEQNNIWVKWAISVYYPRINWINISSTCETLTNEVLQT